MSESLSGGQREITSEWTVKHNEKKKKKNKKMEEKKLEERRVVSWLYRNSLTFGGGTTIIPKRRYL